MRFGTAAKMMALDHTGKTPSLAGSNHVHKFFAFKDVNQHAVSWFGLVAVPAGRINLDVNLAKKSHRRKVMLAKVSLHAFAQPRFLDELDQANLRRLVAVFGRGLTLSDHARAGLQDRRRADVTLVIEQLRHADFFS